MHRRHLKYNHMWSVTHCSGSQVCKEVSKGSDAQHQAHPAHQAQQHLLKVRELMVPSAVPEPDEDQTEVFLAAAERGNTTKLRRVRLLRLPCSTVETPEC